ncbi:MAG: hypothetical protein U5Q16_08440 [Gammaproteobacteria bacterium]|nr:hypothetical protein [Gammaproteobacteria bacterium]
MTRFPRSSLAAMTLAVMACTAETAPPVAQEPRCEPRRTTDPARLTLHSSAEQHGAIPPCRGTIEFAIPRHTALRRVEGAIVLSSDGGEQPRSQAFALDLSGTGRRYVSRGACLRAG